uniref:Uncharacterized protein n=1 Tax=Rhipicephalus zambeziensis TaxID=60191 RepID=A0A224YFU5_9ACAR
MSCAFRRNAYKNVTQLCITFLVLSTRIRWVTATNKMPLAARSRNRRPSFPTLHLRAPSPFCTYPSCLSSISVSRTLHRVASRRAVHYGALDLTEPIGCYSPFLLKDVFFG